MQCRLQNIFFFFYKIHFCTTFFHFFPSAETDPDPLLAPLLNKPPLPPLPLTAERLEINLLALLDPDS